MNGSAKAGNGRGNNRRHSPRPQGKGNNPRQNGEGRSEGGVSRNFSGTQKTGGQKNHGKNGEGRPARGSGHLENQGGQTRNRKPKLPLQRYDIPFYSASFKKGGEKVPFFDRPKWVPPKVDTEPLPVPDCLWCGKPIKDISLAISDKDTGAPVHFECVAARIAGGEILEKGDVVTYIGGGRFGVVCFGASKDPHSANRSFKIKKIIEWEEKDKKADWRSAICDRYSTT